jgi:S1/P1 Nuclease
MGNRTMGNGRTARRAQVIRRLVLLFAALAGLSAAPALAWGEFGHQTTAAIAQANVSPQTRAAIRRLLRAEAGLGTPYCRVRSLAEASYWPDCIRREGWRWGYTFAWHYQTMNVCKPYDPRSNCAGGNCVTGQIERNQRILADKALPTAQRLEALAFLVHFVGDLHMPLHSGDNDDRGGNDVTAMYGIAPGRNLHAVWDGPLAERAITSALPDLVRIYNPKERDLLDTGEPADWGRESWQYARTLVYRQALDRDPCEAGATASSIVWDEDDTDVSLFTLQQRISQAGLRLARLLDEALAR